MNDETGANDGDTAGDFEVRGKGPDTTPPKRRGPRPGPTTDGDGNPHSRPVLDVEGETKSEETGPPSKAAIPKKGWRLGTYLVAALAAIAAIVGILAWINTPDVPMSPISAAKDKQEVIHDSTAYPPDRSVEPAAAVAVNAEPAATYHALLEETDNAPQGKVAALPDPLHINVGKCTARDVRLECPKGTSKCRLVITRCATVPHTVR